jgi:hypothetical protein
LALALSLVVPGAGQVYNGHYGKGAVMFGSAALTASSIVLTIADALELDDDRSGTGVHLLGATGIGIVVWSWIDAPLSARAINRGLETGSVTIGIAPRVRIDAAGRVDLDLARVAF